MRIKTYRSNIYFLVKIVLLILSLNIFSSCKSNNEGSAPDSSTQPAVPDELRFEVSETTIDINTNFVFTARGGQTPYSFSVPSGPGSITADTGVFSAGPTPGIATVRVTDSSGKSTDASITIIPRVTLSPSVYTMAINNLKTFVASGGEPPYTYTIESGGGSIDSANGLFTAGASPGLTVVKATDASGLSSLVNVTVNPAIAITPVNWLLVVNGTKLFSASGGVPPYTFSVSTGLGSIDSTSGLYTAPTTSGLATVRVTDVIGNISESAITVNGPLSISPATLNISTNGVHTFVGQGGLPPYTFSLVSGGGSIHPTSGDFTAPVTAGTSIVRVTDSASQSVTASISIYSALTLSPQTITMGVNTTQTFVASGGYGALTFSVQNGAGSIHPTSGLFTAGPGVGTTDIIVSDTIGNSLAARITVITNLAISPNQLKLPVFSTAQFSGNLGSSPYSFSVFAGTGTIGSSTGLYTAGSVAGQEIVRVTDMGMSTADSTVTLIEPVEITAGTFHFCVRYNEGSLKCWGLNSSGQLGLGDTATRGDGAFEGGANLPLVNLGTGRTAKMVAAGHTHTCAILDNDKVKCWGANSQGQLGLESTISYGIAANQMGDNLPYVNLGTGRTAKSLSAGASHTCAILDNDTLKCWGLNSYGQLGRNNVVRAGNTAGTMGDVLTAINLGVGRTAYRVSAGLDQTCVILDDRSLKCFGRNNYGQLGYDSIDNWGDATGEMEILPTVNLGAGNTAAAISAGQSHTCVVLASGNSHCWGLGTTGQLGRNNALTMGKALGEMNTVMTTPIGLGFSAVMIHASLQRTCAMSSTGQTKCWGTGSNGQLGNGNTATMGDYTGEMATITPINFGTSITAQTMASASSATCVITTNKRIKCFGSAASGALLNESTTSNIGDAPTEIGNGMPWVNH